jgi:hypothetical protein
MMNLTVCDPHEILSNDCESLSSRRSSDWQDRRQQKPSWRDQTKVVPHGKNSNCVVVWDNNGGSGTITTRAIGLEPWRISQVAVAARVDGEGDPEPSDSDSITSSSGSDSLDDQRDQDLGEEDEGNGVEADDEVEPLLKRDGQVWTVSGDVLIDPSGNRDHHSARITWNHELQLEERNALQYFTTCFSIGYIWDILHYTNEVMDSRRLGAPIPESELLHWSGIRVFMTIEQVKGDIGDLWNHVDDLQRARRSADYVVVGLL